MRSALQAETVQILLRSLGSYDRRTAVMAFEKEACASWSFPALFEQTRQLATGLTAAGLRRGTRAVLSAPSTVQWVIACCALVEAGAVPVPVDTQAGDEDLRHILKDSRAQWIFTTATLSDRLAERCTDHGCRIIVLDAGEEDPRSWKRYLTDPRGDDMPAVRPDEVAVLFYTSGTTGLPKGVPLTHRNLISNLRGLAAERVLFDSDRVLLPLPLHHVYPFTVGLLTPLASGVPVVLPHSLLGPQVLRGLTEGMVTVIVAVPRFYTALATALEARMRQYGAPASALFRQALRLSTAVRRCCGWRIGRWLFSPLHRRFAPRLRMVASGGSALDPQVAWKLEGLGWEVGSGYGLTETSPILTFNVPGSRRFDSAGVPLAGVQIRIGEADPQTGVGEVQAKGANVFSGYLNLPDTTRKAFTPDGYFRTGDLGVLNDGHLILTGRVSSMIVLAGGENVNPEQVEAVLESSPVIREAAVLEHDHRLAALLVPETSALRGSRPDELDVRLRGELQRLAASLPTHHRISAYALTLEPLPRTRLGKIRRHKLGSLYAAAKSQGRPAQAAGALALEDMAAEDRLLLEHPQALRVWQWLPGRFTKAWLTPETHLHLDLAVDSLEWLSLTLELREQVGITLRDDAIARIETVRDLLREAAEADAASGSQLDLIAHLQRPRELLDPVARRWIDPQSASERTLGRALFGLAKLAMTRGFGVTVQGAEFLPRTGPLLLVPNHVSLLDPLALLTALPPSLLQETYWSGWTGIMFKDVFMRWVSRATRTVPIQQGGGALASMAFGAAILDAGHPLVWFAEGGRSYDGHLQPFQPGVGLLLQSRPVPAVPVWIEGGHEALPRGARWPKTFRRFSVTFGQPLDPAQLERQGMGDKPHHRIAAALHEEVAKLAAAHVAGIRLTEARP